MHFFRYFRASERDKKLGGWVALATVERDFGWDECQFTALTL